MCPADKRTRWFRNSRREERLETVNDSKACKVERPLPFRRVLTGKRARTRAERSYGIRALGER